MAVSARQETATGTRTKIAPTGRDQFHESWLYVDVVTTGGVIHIFGDETTADFVTASDENPIHGLRLQGNDEVWVESASGSVDIQVLETGV